MSSGAERRCGWCGASPLQARQRFCGQRCRQTAWRLRRRSLLEKSSSAPGATPGSLPGLRFAYADPPYPGLAGYYKGEASYAGEVDHDALLSRLEERRQAGELAGWALSTSSKALRQVLPLCPPSARVCAWVKPIGVPRATYGLHSTWEALVVVGGRALRPGKRDWLCAMPARGGGTLIGRKPIAFCAFLFDALGMVPGDELEDMFPGTGVVARSWAELSWRPSATPSVVGRSTTPGTAVVHDASLVHERPADRRLEVA